MPPYKYPKSAPKSPQFTINALPAEIKIQLLVFTFRTRPPVRVFGKVKTNDFCNLSTISKSFYETYRANECQIIREALGKNGCLSLLIRVGMAFSKSNQELEGTEYGEGSNKVKKGAKEIGGDGKESMSTSAANVEVSQWDQKLHCISPEFMRFLVRISWAVSSLEAALIAQSRSLHLPARLPQVEKFPTLGSLLTTSPTSLLTPTSSSSSSTARQSLGQYKFWPTSSTVWTPAILLFLLHIRFRFSSPSKMRKLHKHRTYYAFGGHDVDALRWQDISSVWARALECLGDDGEPDDQVEKRSGGERRGGQERRATMEEIVQCVCFLEGINAGGRDWAVDWLGIFSKVDQIVKLEFSPGDGEKGGGQTEKSEDEVDSSSSYLRKE